MQTINIWYLCNYNLFIPTILFYYDPTIPGVWQPTMWILSTYVKSNFLDSKSFRYSCTWVHIHIMVTTEQYVGVRSYMIVSTVIIFHHCSLDTMQSTKYYSVLVQVSASGIDIYFMDNSLRCTSGIISA